PSQTRSRGSFLSSKVSARSSIRSLTSRKTASFSPIRSSRELIEATLPFGGCRALFDEHVAVLVSHDSADRGFGVLVPGCGEEVRRVRPYSGVLGNRHPHDLNAIRPWALAEKRDQLQRCLVLLGFRPDSFVGPAEGEIVVDDPFLGCVAHRSVDVMLAEERAKRVSLRRG